MCSCAPLFRLIRNQAFASFDEPDSQSEVVKELCVDDLQPKPTFAGNQCLRGERSVHVRLKGFDGG